MAQKPWQWALIPTLVVTHALMADTVTMTTGREVQGVVLREDDRSIAVALDYGTITLPKSHVAKVARDAKPPAARPTPAATVARRAAGPRIPTWLTAVKVLTAQPWAAEFHQIPATVIDAGVMKNVPYQSFRCGGDYEVNVYGDPDAPAAIEIGVYRQLLKDPRAKDNCVAFVASVLGDPVDAGILRLKDRKKDLVVRNGLSMEITPETADDAYGGWWVSAYDEAALDKVRAGEKEIEQITAEREAPKPAAIQARATTPRTPPVAKRGDDDELLGWSTSDFGYSRQPKPSASGGGGRVYVRGYYRKNGTYVSGHTRSAPGRR